MQIDFPDKLKFHHKIICLINREKTLRTLNHIKPSFSCKIIENKKSINFISDDGFETQIGKRCFWYDGKSGERSSQAVLEMGKATYLQDCKIGPFLNERRVEIGSFCSFGPGVDLRIDGVRGKSQFTSYPLFKIDPSSKLLNKKIDEINDFYIKIGNDVFIGENTKIMQNVEIGDGVIIGARSIVTANKKLEPYGIYAGAPAKLVKYRFSKEIINEFLKLKWWKKTKSEIIKSGLQHIDFEKEKDKALSILKRLNA